jgi:hypothetical protein
MLHTLYQQNVKEKTSFFVEWLAMDLIRDAKGDVVGYYHSGEVVNIRPEDMTLRGAAVIDDNSEAHQDIMACARAIVYGSGRGRGEPWFAERSTRRRNPSSRRR